MKIRSSFVANSSSSSFIIGCSQVPTTVEESGDIWFENTKDFVAPIIIKGLFEELIPFTIDYDVLLELSKNVKWRSIYNYGNKNPEFMVISKLAANFECCERYKDYYSFDRELPFDIFYKKEEKRLMKKYNTTTIHDKLVPLKERLAIDEKWFNKKDVRERFIQEVQQFIRSFSRHEVLMHGTFADDEGALGSELEHGSHWEKFPTHIRFSQH